MIECTDLHQLNIGDVAVLRLGLSDRTKGHYLKAGSVVQIIGRDQLEFDIEHMFTVIDINGHQFDKRMEAFRLISAKEFLRDFRQSMIISFAFLLSLYFAITFFICYQSIPSLSIFFSIFICCLIFVIIANLAGRLPTDLVFFKEYFLFKRKKVNNNGEI